MHTHTLSNSIYMTAWFYSIACLSRSTIHPVCDTAVHTQCSDSYHRKFPWDLSIGELLYYSCCCCVWWYNSLCVCADLVRRATLFCQISWGWLGTLLSSGSTRLPAAKDWSVTSVSPGSVLPVHVYSHVCLHDVQWPSASSSMLVALSRTALLWGWLRRQRRRGHWSQGTPSLNQPLETLVYNTSHTDS